MAYHPVYVSHSSCPRDKNYIIYEAKTIEEYEYLIHKDDLPGGVVFGFMIVVLFIFIFLWVRTR